MNVLDLMILVIAVVAAMRGVKTGLMRQVGSLGGFMLGLLAGALIAPAVGQLLPLGAFEPLFVFGLFLGIAFATSLLGETIGSHLAGLMERLHLRPLDGVLGGAFGFGGALFIIWLLASAFGGLTGPTLSQGLASSAILRTLDDTLPPAPEVMSRLERAIGASAFPRVFVGLEPVPAPPVTGATTEAVNAAVAAAGASTVKVEGAGCGGLSDGTGFVVGDGLVATNAHVVAGINRPTVVDAAGRHRATLAYIDPNLDLAVLRTTGLAGPPLAINPAGQRRGTQAAVLGYPGGGPFTAGPAAILASQTAVGRNIYDTGLVSRTIYVLQAAVRPGNSGGPLVTPDGRVIGLIFATSVRDENIGFAITADQILPGIRQAAGTVGAVAPGACFAG